MPSARKQMRSGPATRTAFLRGFLLCLSPHGGGMIASARPHSSECRICQSELPIRHFAITNLRPLRWPAVLPAPRSKVGEEAATPGQPVALARVFWNVPRQFTLENRRLPLALPQSFGKLRNSHVSLNPLSARLFGLATQKSSAVVQNLWRMRLPCGRLRKTKNEYSRHPFHALVISITYTLYNYSVWGRPWAPNTGEQNIGKQFSPTVSAQRGYPPMASKTLAGGVIS
jgi:hypothetical protein